MKFGILTAVFGMTLGAFGSSAQALEMNAVGDLRLIKTNALTRSVSLSELRRESFFGLGMPEGLNRELLILDGKEYVGGFQGLRYSSAAAPDDLRVSFLVYGYIPKWRALPIPSSVRTFADFEKYLPGILARHGLGTGTTVPFRLVARVDGLKWFVVNGMGNGIPDFQKSFFRSRYLGGLDAAEIEGFGIYSEDHQGAWTSPASKIHFHFRTTSGPAFVGHLDDEVFFQEGAQLWIPDEN